MQETKVFYQYSDKYILYVLKKLTEFDCKLHKFLF